MVDHIQWERKKGMIEVNVKEICYDDAQHWKGLKTERHVSRDTWHCTLWCGELPSHGGNNYTDCNEECNTWQWMDGRKEKERKKERGNENDIKTHVTKMNN